MFRQKEVLRKRKAGSPPSSLISDEMIRLHLARTDKNLSYALFGVKCDCLLFKAVAHICLVAIWISCRRSVWLYPDRIFSNAFTPAFSRFYLEVPAFSAYLSFCFHLCLSKPPCLIRCSTFFLLFVSTISADN